MQNAIAFCDDDVVVVAWSYGHKVTGCMGFAVYRIGADGKETALPSIAVFPGFTSRPGQTTATFPVQKFYWKDPYARLVADRTGSRQFRYKVVPLAGKPGALKPMPVASSSTRSRPTAPSSPAATTSVTARRSTTTRTSSSCAARALAAAYATHVLDVYDHFSWRWTIQQQGKAPNADATLSLDPDTWQSRYFDARGNIKVAQLRFWVSALPAP